MPTYRIIWTPKALTSYLVIVTYLEAMWYPKVVQNFVDRVDIVLDKIQRHPRLYQKAENGKRVRRAVLSKHNSLYYEVRGKTIILLRFSDNRQFPRLPSE